VAASGGVDAQARSEVGVNRIPGSVLFRFRSASAWESLSVRYVLGTVQRPRNRFLCCATGPSGP
jgi:hypothetical protein